MSKQIKITYLKKAEKFLHKNQNIITESQIDELIVLAIKKRIFLMDANIDLKDLKGSLQGKSRIRKGNIRVIFEIVENEILIESIVENIDFRGNVYK